MSNDPVPVKHVEHLELSVEELLWRGRPFPPGEEMVIDELHPPRRVKPSSMPFARDVCRPARSGGGSK